MATAFLRLYVFSFVAFLMLLEIPIALASNSALVKSSPGQQNQIIEQSCQFHDKTRNRIIPVEIYVSRATQKNAKLNHHQLPVVIINHGYGAKNTEYSSLAKALASNGYYVASIQHDLNIVDPKIRTVI